MKYRLEADDQPQQPNEVPEAASDARANIQHHNDRIAPALVEGPETGPSTGYQIPR